MGDYKMNEQIGVTRMVGQLVEKTKTTEECTLDRLRVIEDTRQRVDSDEINLGIRREWVPYYAEPFLSCPEYSGFREA
jgi:hypothetical protein